MVAARISGAGEGTIIARYLLPSFASHSIVSITLAIPYMILGETALSFLGLGMQPPAVSRGVLLMGPRTSAPCPTALAAPAVRLRGDHRLDVQLHG